MAISPTAPPPRPRRGLGAFARHDATGLQLLTSAAIIGACVLTIRPRGWDGSGLATMVLLAVNSLLLLSRHLPDTVIGQRQRLAVLATAVLAGAALLALSTEGPPYLFAFYAAGHAGFRLPANRATAIAVASSVVCGGVLLFHLGPGHAWTPWYVGAATGFAVLIGMTSRSRSEVVSSALAAAAAAERAAAAEAREAVLAERGRIARDVHDVLAHSLAGINMQLELADALLDTGDLDRVREATKWAQSLVRESMQESQRTVRALRDDALPLVQTLRAMLDSSGHPDSLSIVGSERPIQTRPAQALIRIAQESLTNATKHAPGAAVGIEVDYAPDVVELTVVNGPGTSTGTGEGSGMGLVGMRERAALLGGTVTAGPVTEGPHRGGWRVQAIIPV